VIASLRSQGSCRRGLTDTQTHERAQGGPATPDPQDLFNHTPIDKSTTAPLNEERRTRTAYSGMRVRGVRFRRTVRHRRSRWGRLALPSDTKATHPSSNSLEFWKRLYSFNTTRPEVQWDSIVAIRPSLNPRHLASTSKLTAASNIPRMKDEPYTPIAGCPKSGPVG